MGEVKLFIGLLLAVLGIYAAGHGQNLLDLSAQRWERALGGRMNYHVLLFAYQLAGAAVVAAGVLLMYL